MAWQGIIYPILTNEFGYRIGDMNAKQVCMFCKHFKQSNEVFLHKSGSLISQLPGCPPEETRMEYCSCPTILRRLGGENDKSDTIVRTLLSHPSIDQLHICNEFLPCQEK